jgi:hypothetical protein
MSQNHIASTRIRVLLLSCGAMTVLLGACGVRETTSPPKKPAAAAELAAATAHLYVAANGLDSNPGTRAAPFRNIARAAQAATAGTVVHVAPGIYPGGIKTTVNGTPTARILFRSTEKWGAKIVPPPAAQTNAAWDNRGNYVDIVGFDIDGSKYQGGKKWATGIYSGGSYDTIRENHVHHIATDVACAGSGGSGIGVDSYYRGVKSDVVGNNVHDIGPAGCRFIQGIYINTPGTVRNNIVYRIAEAGIHLWHDANNVIITNNTVSASNTGIVVGGGDYYYTKGPNDHTHVYNNIVFDNKNGISEQGATGKNNSYRNNLVFQNSAADWRLLNGLTHSGTISAPPGFVAYSRTGTPDFRLTATSPAIGKGIATYADATDFHGKARNHVTGIDIGACQH